MWNVTVCACVCVCAGPPVEGSAGAAAGSAGGIASPRGGGAVAGAIGASKSHAYGTRGKGAGEPPATGSDQLNAALDPPVLTAQCLNGGIGVFAHRLVDVARKLAFDDADDSAFVVRACTWAVMIQFKRDLALALISTLFSLTHLGVA